MEAHPHISVDSPIRYDWCGDSEENCDQSLLLDKAFVLPAFVMTVSLMWQSIIYNRTRTRTRTRTHTRTRTPPLEC